MYNATAGGDDGRFLQHFRVYYLEAYTYIISSLDVIFKRGA